MAVYYKFKSAKDYDSITLDGPFISVGTLKEKVFQFKHLGRGTDFDLLVTNAQTNEEYLDEVMLIPKNTSVLIRRVPGIPRLPIVTKPKVEEIEETEQFSLTVRVSDSSALRFPKDSEWDEFGNDLYAIPEVFPVQLSNPVPDAPPTNKAEEDSKIKALIDTPALDWQHQGSDGFGPDRGFGRGGGGRMGGRGFGFERKTPPQGYICHRCKTPGHFIQHCPTNGDPNYDIKRVKPPTGIPKSMLMATPDGSYALPGGAAAVLRPNEAAFEREIEGLPSITRSVGDFPPELHCPLCKEVMKDAVLTSKCCFMSFCDKCIRDHIITKSACVCGATNILADDLLPNKTLRDTINRILECGECGGNSSAGSTFQVQDMESAHIAHPKVPSLTLSPASRGEKHILSVNEETTKTKEVEEEKAITSRPQTLEKVKATKVVDESEATHESISVKEQASQGSTFIVDEEVQQKMAASEAVKKKKKKKVCMPSNDFQWKTSQDLVAENYMMPMGGPTAYNPYWNGMQPGFEGYMSSYAAPMPYMGGYGLGPMDMSFGPVMPQDPFGGMHSYMFPVALPQRDLANFGMGMNISPPAMSREEFEARKAASMRRKHENERRVESREREPLKDREFGREVSSSGDVHSMQQKIKFAPQTSTGEHNQNRRRPESSPDVARNAGPPCLLPRKRKSEYHDHDIDKDNNNSHYDHGDLRHHRKHSDSRGASEVSSKSAAVDRKTKTSVFSRINFREEEMMKKRKLHSSKEAPPPSDSGASATYHKASSNGYYDDYKPKTVTTTVTSSRGRSNAASVDCESSDDDRHFKRKRSRYEPSPPPPSEWGREESRHPRGSTRERERECNRSSYRKHR